MCRLHGCSLFLSHNILQDPSNFFFIYTPYKSAILHNCNIMINWINVLPFLQPIFKADAELRLQIQTICKEMSSESAKALRELSSDIRSMTIPSPAKCHISAATSAAANLKTALSNDITVWETVHVAMIALLLSELVNCTTEIASSVDELAELALFKSSDLVHSAVVNPVSDEDTPPQQVAIDISGWLFTVNFIVNNCCDCTNGLMNILSQKIKWGQPKEEKKQK